MVFDHLDRVVVCAPRYVPGGRSRLRRTPAFPGPTGLSALIARTCTTDDGATGLLGEPGERLAKVMVLFIAHDPVADQPPDDAGYGPEPLYLHVREAAVPERPSLRHSETVQRRNPTVGIGRW
jgi:hypothetical protein